MNRPINLICHSMGCNLGILAADKSKKINKIILISPEFGEYSPKEQEQIKYEKIHPNIQTAYGENQPQINSNMLKSLILFKKSKQLATATIEKINIPILIIYSKDDTFIPKNYLNDLKARKENIKLATIDTKLHNPLISQTHNQKTIRLIKNYLKPKNV